MFVPKGLGGHYEVVTIHTNNAREKTVPFAPLVRCGWVWVGHVARRAEPEEKGDVACTPTCKTHATLN